MVVFCLSAPLVLTFVKAKSCTKPFSWHRGDAPDTRAPGTRRQLWLFLPGCGTLAGSVFGNVEVKVNTGKFDQTSLLLSLSLSADLWAVSCPHTTDMPPECAFQSLPTPAKLDSTVCLFRENKNK